MDFTQIARSLRTTALIAIAGLYLTGALPFIAAAPLAAASLLVPRSLMARGKVRESASLNLALAALGFTAVAVELAVRVLGSEFMYYRPHEILFIRWPEYPEVFRYRPSVEIEMRSYGDLAAILGNREDRVYRDEVFSTDPYGFRNAAGLDGTPFDLVVLGDSFTAGNGNTQDSIWPALLASSTGLQVYNLGIPGSVWNSYANLALEADRLGLGSESTVLLVIFPGNDLDEPYGPLLDPDDLDRAGPLRAFQVRLQNFQAQSIFRSLGTRVLRSAGSEPAVTTGTTAGGHRILFFDDYIERSERTEAEIQGHENFDRLVSTVLSIHTITTSRSARFAVVFMPSKEMVYDWVLDGGVPPEAGAGHRPDALTESLIPYLQTAQIPFIDLTEPLRIAAVDAYLNDRELIWWPDDSHPNPLGQEIMADLIVDFLAAPEG